LKERITEVTVISNFITNIIRFSETANLFDRNFTVKGVLIRKIVYFLENFHYIYLFTIIIFNIKAKKLEIFF